MVENKKQKKNETNIEKKTVKTTTEDRGRIPFYFILFYF